MIGAHIAGDVKITVGEPGTRLEALNVSNRSEKILRRMVAEGHRIGNHTFLHRRLTELSAEETRQQLDACTAIIEVACGVTPTVWRAPMFARNDEVDRIALGYGLTHMGADIIPDDWRFDDPERIAEKVLAQASPRAVVCLHDGIPPDGGNGVDHRQATVDALRLILEASQ